MYVSSCKPQHHALSINNIFSLNQKNKMQRFNAFLMIHKGLRALMYDVSMSLQHTDFASAPSYPHAFEKLEHTLEIFDAHAGHEDKYIFCLLEACNPSLQEEMEKEHVTDIALSNELRSLMAAYKTADDAEKARIGSRIGYTFNEFISFNLHHLNKEELVVNESLWHNYTDLDIVQANSRLIGSLSPDEVKRNAVWMMRGCNNAEIAGWINTLKKQAPEQVIQLLLSIAQQELPSQRFEALQNSILEIA
jgi:hypothetical protein